jgi:glutaminyl-peptide cyclotransferase
MAAEEDVAPTPPRASATRGLAWALLPVLVFGAIAIGTAIVLSAGDDGAASAAQDVPAATTRRFDGRRAFADTRAQVRRGPRPAGSAASRRLAAWLRAQLPGGRYETVPGGLRNVVGTLPGTRPAIVIGAHYDTKRLPGFVGANDGAAGPAVVLELARALARERAADRAAASERPELRFVLFDGEEATDDGDFLGTGIRGSRAYARRHAGELGEVIVVDFVGQRGLRLPREGGSHAELWADLRAAAQRVGVGAVFPPREVGQIYDDHTPFTRAGIPAIDLIDFGYACFHQRCDTLDQISRASLDAVGEALTELLRDRPVPAAPAS